MGEKEGLLDGDLSLPSSNKPWLQPLEPFEYQPLNSSNDGPFVRLAFILQGKGDDQVECVLRTFPLKKISDFCALSYVWGDPTPGTPVYCNGGTVLLITKNLYNALCNVRDPDRAVAIWADAICINQVDHEERAQQVQIMRQIYAQAVAVLVYLGDITQAHRNAVRTLCQLGKSFRQSDKKFDEICDGSFEFSDFLARNRPEISPDEWADLAVFFNHPWFKRSWIVQEVAVARSRNGVFIICGGADSLIMWRELADALRWLVGSDNRFYTVGINYACAIERARYAYYNEKTMDIVSIVDHFRYTAASDPKDKIFAFLGLQYDADGKIASFIPNYSMTTKDVYCKFASHVLERGNFALFSVPRLPKDTGIADLPSWVPDWSKSVDVTSDVTSTSLSSFRTLYNSEDSSLSTDDPSGWYNASANSMPCCTFAEDGRILKLVGYILDKIEMCATNKTMWSREKDRTWKKDTIRVIALVRMYDDWDSLAQTHCGSLYVTGETVYDAFWQVMAVGGKSAVNERAKKWIETEFAMTKKYRWMLRLHLDRVWWLFSAGFLAVYYTVALLNQVFPRIFKSPASQRVNMPYLGQHGRRIVRTKGQLLASAPAQSEEGDYIAIVKGCKMPLVIRRAGTYWELIGDCYCHGVMKGEAFDEGKCEPMLFV